VEESKWLQTKTQSSRVNYKLADGTLINLYAADVKDLETGLTDLAMVAALVKSTSKELSGGSPSHSATSSDAVAAISPALQLPRQYAVTPTAQPADSASKDVPSRTDGIQDRYISQGTLAGLYVCSA
jgi:hypothetical protein